MQIAKDDLTDGAIADLLNRHLQEMHKYSPPESIHAITPEKLRDPAVTFWAARMNGELAGCAALKEHSAELAELKSMKTSPVHLRKGVAKNLLHQVFAEAKERGYQTVKLETGSHEAFVPAVALYQQFGFEPCAPFADYSDDPYSLFFVKRL
ncbi:GNAT family N-acetyltransferase [Reinekea marinisedimentorum]|uniref:Putative acetyltransferase n=1 Tax=Reinekea marinisedimentorum TaxID=230495 RepID=A0A4R3IAL4_9GAMM|nr:GNAT family N-acetyltransferase [Reinekea marinisedimentorum]TCS43350.1 putative acetyltransferase [Reinekea marinisedimentorum]